MFFARKFEAVIDQEIINSVDKTFHEYFITHLPGLNSYWQNMYHHLDTSTQVKDAQRTGFRSLTHLTVTTLGQVKHTYKEAIRQ